MAEAMPSHQSVSHQVFLAHVRDELAGAAEDQRARKAERMGSGGRIHLVLQPVVDAQIAVEPD